MSNDAQVDPLHVLAIAKKLVEVLAPEDIAVRTRAIETAELLLGHPVGDQLIKSKETPAISGKDLDFNAFFNREEKMKPSDHVHLCAAYHFAKYGSAPFSVEELRSIAQEAGIVLPDRPDMTLTNAAKSGRKLYQSLGKGVFKATASGGLLFGERWNVRPGGRAK